jgi:hypothetical protein
MTIYSRSAPTDISRDSLAAGADIRNPVLRTPRSRHVPHALRPRAAARHATYCRAHVLRRRCHARRALGGCVNLLYMLAAAHRPHRCSLTLAPLHAAFYYRATTSLLTVHAHAGSPLPLLRCRCAAVDISCCCMCNRITACRLPTVRKHLQARPLYRSHPPGRKTPRRMKQDFPRASSSACFWRRVPWVENVWCRTLGWLCGFMRECGSNEGNTPRARALRVRCWCSPRLSKGASRARTLRAPWGGRRGGARRGLGERLVSAHCARARRCCRARAALAPGGLSGSCTARRGSWRARKLSRQKGPVPPKCMQAG